MTSSASPILPRAYRNGVLALFLASIPWNVWIGWARSEEARPVFAGLALTALPLLPFMAAFGLLVIGRAPAGKRTAPAVLVAGLLLANLAVAWLLG